MSELSTMDAVVSGFGNKAIEALRLTLGEAWDSLTPEERTSCTHLMLTLAKAHLYEIAGYDVSNYIGTLKVAFQQWQVVGKQVIVDGVRSVAKEMFGLGGSFAGGALAAFIKAAV